MAKGPLCEHEQFAHVKARRAKSQLRVPSAKGGRPSERESLEKCSQSLAFVGPSPAWSQAGAGLARRPGTRGLRDFCDVSLGRRRLARACPRRGAARSPGAAVSVGARNLHEIDGCACPWAGAAPPGRPRRPCPARETPGHELWLGRSCLLEGGAGGESGMHNRQSGAEIRRRTTSDRALLAGGRRLGCGQGGCGRFLGQPTRRSPSSCGARRWSCAPSCRPP